MKPRDFKEFSFVAVTSPGWFGITLAVIVIGALFSLGFESTFGSRLSVDPLTFAFFFISLNILVGVVVRVLASNFKIKWAFFIVLLNQMALVASIFFSLISRRVTFFDSMVLWTAVSYTLWLVSLTGLGGLRINVKTLILALFQPLLILTLLLFSVEVMAVDLLAPLVLVAVGVTIPTLALLFSEHLFSLVFAGMSGMAELSSFLKGVRGETASLSFGQNIDAPLQFLKFDSDGKKRVFVAPWLHSGPLRSVGGGNLSTQSIEKLNKTYGDSYFLHVPSNHEYNPSMDVSKRLMYAVEEEGTYEPLKVSRLIKREVHGLSVIGQRIGDVYLISYSSSLVDDYDISIFASLRDKYKDKKILFIDSHPNFPLKECMNVEAFSEEAKAVEELTDGVIRELSREKPMDAEIGTSIQFFEQYSVFALVFRTVRGRVLYFIADTNGLSEREKKRIKDIAEGLGIANVLMLTTDTHSLSVAALMHREEIPKAVVEATMKRAMGTKKAKFLYRDVSLKNVRILGKTYYELIAVTKILSRVVPVLFFLLFLFLAILLWIF
jgi:predicted neutral ceramidase superfamily lipid hydrolase